MNARRRRNLIVGLALAAGVVASVGLMLGFANTDVDLPFIGVHTSPTDLDCLERAARDWTSRECARCGVRRDEGAVTLVVQESRGFDPGLGVTVLPTDHGFEVRLASASTLPVEARVRYGRITGRFVSSAAEACGGGVDARFECEGRFRPSSLCARDDPDASREVR